MAEKLSAATIRFGERIRTRRLELGWSREHLAAQAQLHWTYIGQIERGERNISLRNITRLAAALDQDPAVLVKGLPAW
ncbi:MAG: helix-turn-helix transcriptional regulator [Thermoleophilia bacterium]|nr:helix-turn-helix transcriptional regulator [Thermoleophilia bacterium]